MGGAIKPLSYNWCVILWVGRCQKSNYPYPYIMMYEMKPFFVIWLSKNFGNCQFRSANGPRVPWSWKLMMKMKAQQMIAAFTLMVFLCRIDGILWGKRTDKTFLYISHIPLRRNIPNFGSLYLHHLDIICSSWWLSLCWCEMESFSTFAAR